MKNMPRRQPVCNSANEIKMFFASSPRLRSNGSVRQWIDGAWTDAFDYNGQSPVLKPKFNTVQLKSDYMALYKNIISDRTMRMHMMIMIHNVTHTL